MKRPSWALWLVLLFHPPAGAAGLTADPLPFRDYGYFIGDVLSRCWRVEGGASAVIDRPRLPHPLGRWLVVRAVSWEDRRLCLDFQVDYAPFTTETVEVPGWRVVFRADGREMPLSLPAWRLTLSPLRPIQSLKGEAFMRDGALPAFDTAAVRRRMWLGAALFVLGAAGLVWHLLGGRRPVRWPFCRALLALTRLGEGEGDRLRAYLILHRALDAYWNGRWWGRLEAFMERHPAFRPLEAELAAFAESSRGLFFIREGERVVWKQARLRRLARRLALEEIRHGGLAG